MYNKLLLLHLPAGVFDDGPSIGSPDSRFHVIFGFGEPCFDHIQCICYALFLFLEGNQKNDR